MAAEPIPLNPSSPGNSDPLAAPRRPRMSGRNRLLFFLTAWLIVLMPFLFWWNTWFGRPLTDQKMTAYLQDEAHPRHIQHAIVQLGQRMSAGDPGAARWYGDLVRLSAHPREEVRSTDAWVMGQDPKGPGFHEALIKMLQDPSLLVRGNAALSLVRFGDHSGREQIVALLQPVVVTTPYPGQVRDTAGVGTAIHQGGLVAKLQDGSQLREIRSPIGGRVRELTALEGRRVSAGDPIATVEPEEEQVWEALRALYLIGRPDDLPAIRYYERELPEISDRLRQQAAATEKAIQERANR